MLCLRGHRGQPPDNDITKKMLIVLCILSTYQNI